MVEAADDIKAMRASESYRAYAALMATEPPGPDKIDFSCPWLGSLGPKEGVPAYEDAVSQDLCDTVWHAPWELGPAKPVPEDQ